MKTDLFAQPIPVLWYTEKAETCFARDYRGDGTYDGSFYCPNCDTNVGDINSADTPPSKAVVVMRCTNCEELFYPNEDVKPKIIEAEFITKPDENGYGRITYNGRYFGLPMALIEDYKRLKEKEINEQNEF